ncbi:hypothetical protein BFP70_04915 [Thioclava sp. SK-1]|uniref:hypothetical protein n=1 Tax=Thioclava sp. SK-1 TaxID=1889770 RepID=UPI0008265E83|nr:hypothetical protein [Thioclava sp. SK-1]OCX66563.1 hypothetical protein BFP70_04915 [Thioclava sp. SK-1]
MSDEIKLATFTADKRRFFSVRIFWCLLQLAALIVVARFFASGGRMWLLIGIILAAQVFGTFIAYRRTFARAWLLTDRRLVNSKGHGLGLGEIAQIHTFLGDVHIKSHNGPKFRIEHLADPEEASAQIQAAKTARAAVAA